MSFYRRYPDGRTQRHDPNTGEFVDCADDEPETRVRKPNEGMIVLPASMIKRHPPARPISFPVLDLTEVPGISFESAKVTASQFLREGVDFSVPELTADEPHIVDG